MTALFKYTFLVFVIMNSDSIGQKVIMYVYFTENIMTRHTVFDSVISYNLL